MQFEPSVGSSSSPGRFPRVRASLSRRAASRAARAAISRAASSPSNKAASAAVFNLISASSKSFSNDDGCVPFNIAGAVSAVSVVVAHPSFPNVSSSGATTTGASSSSSFSRSIPNRDFEFEPPDSLLFSRR